MENSQRQTDCCLNIHQHEQEREFEYSREPIVSNKWKWAAVAGNAAIGVAEIATGNLNAMSVTADGLHNISDAATYYTQAENVINPNISPERIRKRRKMAHFAIAASSLAISAKAGVDLGLDNESAHSAYGIYAAGASLALNSLLFYRLRQGIKRKKGKNQDTHTERDLKKHLLAVDIPSAGLAVVGVLAQKYNVDVEQMAALTSGLIGAYAFRPTSKNLNHTH